MIEYSLSEQTEIPAGGDLSVKVIGVGGAGANVLDRMALEGSEEAELLTLNTDVRALSASVSNNKVQLGATLLKGMAAGGDPELGRQSALEAIDDIRAAVRGYQMAFVCVGLGGGTGSGAAPEVCRVAKEEGVFLVVVRNSPLLFRRKAPDGSGAGSARSNFEIRQRGHHIRERPDGRTDRSQGWRATGVCRR